MKIRPLGSELFRAEGQTAAFRSFAHAPENIHTSVKKYIKMS